jgi:hypothetical protein
MSDQTHEGEFIQVGATPAPVDPVVDLDEENVDDLLNDDVFAEDSFSARLQAAPPLHSVSPTRRITGTPEAMSRPGIGGDASVQDQINQAVAAAMQGIVARLGINENAMHGTPFIAPDQVRLAAPTPPKFAKHYRCDSYPELTIQEKDMTALDRGERPESFPIPGSYIKFTRGHCFLQDKDVNKIRQIEAMRNAPGTLSNGESGGGNPSIYEDDGADIFRCSQGCENFITASKNAYKAHMRATHGVEI